MDLFCAKYPPPEVIEASETHRHSLTLLKEWIDFDCGARCGKTGDYEFPYKCDECDLAFHVDCVWHPIEVKHPIEYTTMDAGERVSLPWIHEHFMMPCNDLKRCNCCKRFEANNDGYYCKRCNFFFHKKCGEEAPESIQHPSHSLHPLWLQITPNNTYCDLCGKTIVDLSYSCKICDFNIDVMSYVWHPPEVEHSSEVNHPYHSLHPLQLFMGGLPEYSDGKCRLCDRKIDGRLFYHCSSCNFSLDMRCVLKPPPQSLLELKVHDHQLTLLPRLRSFTCNACGLSGDRSPYICVQCDFMIHQDCIHLPRVININRHDHRVSRTSVLGVVNSICGVCREKVNWTCGGYLCQRCPGYVVHSKCATREDVVHNEQLTLATRKGNHFECDACCEISNGFMYKDGAMKLDVRCSSIYEPYVHTSHPLHPLYYIPPNKDEICNGCNMKERNVLRCIEDGCEFVLGFKCATLPQVVKHRVNDHPLLLCYGEEEASGKYWCDICEKESDPREWFYTCKDHHACLHTKCVLGDLAGLMPSSTIIYDSRSYEVVLNNSVTRPVCRKCKSRCIYPNILKELGTSDTYCSYLCIQVHRMWGERKILLGFGIR